LSGELRRPTKAEIQAAAGSTVPDVIRASLDVLFCGINPGLYSAATRHHFARPGNRFWRALHSAGFTDRVLSPAEEHLLLDRGYGITNLVARATATAAELRAEELVAGRQRLERKLRRYAPRWVAVLGVGAYRQAFARPAARIGPQSDRLRGTRLWVLPNPSGINAHHPLPDLARAFRALRRATQRTT
jgi:TDG/mug DNA glycosylase family protein